MQHHVDTDTDIDLALDEPGTLRRHPASYATRTVGALILTAALVAAFTGNLTLGSKALPLLMALLAILGIIDAAYGNPVPRR